VIVGLAVTGVLVGQARAADEPKGVTGVSQVLDTMRTGSQLGPADAYALAMSTAGSAIAPKATFGPADPVVQQATQQAVLAAGGQGDTVAKVTEAGDSGIAQTQTAAQPLAVINGPANQGIDDAAGAVNTAATTFGSQIQPLDTTVKQVAQLARSAEAPPGG
jgi:hypothetical protein